MSELLTFLRMDRFGDWAVVSINTMFPTMKLKIVVRVSVLQQTYDFLKTAGDFKSNHNLDFTLSVFHDLEGGKDPRGAKMVLVLEGQQILRFRQMLDDVLRRPAFEVYSVEALKEGELEVRWYEQSVDADRLMVTWTSGPIEATDSRKEDVH